MQSLCLDCRLRREVRSGTGSVFTLCQRGLADPGWPKYPPQPIGQCPHYRSRQEPDPPAVPENFGNRPGEGEQTGPPRD